MKKLNSTIERLSAVILVIILFSACMKDRITRTYTIRTPVFASKSEVLANMKMESPRELGKTGKIYVSGRYIFLNEVEKGVHVIDNIDPSNPVKIGFISIPGNLDVAVKGNTLYADFYADLVAFDITDLLNAKLTSRLIGVFPEKLYSGGYSQDTSEVVVDWITRDTTVAGNVPIPPMGCMTCPPAWQNMDGAFLSASSSSPGKGGSMASFAIVGSYLYAVDRHTLRCISLDNPQNPSLASETNAGWDIETVFPFQDKLILGSQGGLFIFDISNPTQPEAKGNVNHARACDPVVADGNYAYVTLRSGTFCGPTNDELQIINIANLQSPVILKTYPMAGPKGLAKFQNELFVCDGAAGLKVYDATDPLNLHHIATVDGIDTYDVILVGQRALVVAAGGFYQYDVSDVHDIRLLSKFMVN